MIILECTWSQTCRCDHFYRTLLWVYHNAYTIGSLSDFILLNGSSCSPDEKGHSNSEALLLIRYTLMGQGWDFIFNFLLISLEVCSGINQVNYTFSLVGQ